MKLKLLCAALAVIAIALFADFARVASGHGRTHRYEMFYTGHGEEVGIIEHRCGLIVHASADTGMRFKRAAFADDKLITLRAGLR